MVLVRTYRSVFGVRRLLATAFESALHCFVTAIREFTSRAYHQGAFCSRQL